MRCQYTYLSQARRHQFIRVASATEYIGACSCLVTPLRRVITTVQYCAATTINDNAGCGSQSASNIQQRTIRRGTAQRAGSYVKRCRADNAVAVNRGQPHVLAYRRLHLEAKPASVLWTSLNWYRARGSGRPADQQMAYCSAPLGEAHKWRVMANRSCIGLFLD